MRRPTVESIITSPAYGLKAAHDEPLGYNLRDITAAVTHYTPNDTQATHRPHLALTSHEIFTNVRRQICSGFDFT